MSETADAARELLLEQLDDVVVAGHGDLHIPQQCLCGSTAGPYCSSGSDDIDWRQKSAAAYPGRTDRLCDACVETWTDAGMPTEPTELGTPLTAKQHEAVATAYRMGYFEIPRAVTQEDLAAELDISYQALGERLRRGITALVEQALGGETV